MAPETVATLVQQAIIGHRAVRITHCKDGDTEPTTRLVLPFYLVQCEANKRVYVYAYCSLRKAKRSFRIDRITDISVGDKPVPSTMYQRVAPMGLSQEPTGRILGRAQWQS